MSEWIIERWKSMRCEGALTFEWHNFYRTIESVLKKHLSSHAGSDAAPWRLSTYILVNAVEGGASLPCICRSRWTRGLWVVCRSRPEEQRLCHCKHCAAVASNKFCPLNTETGKEGLPKDYLSDIYNKETNVVRRSDDSGEASPLRRPRRGWMNEWMNRWFD